MGAESYYIPLVDENLGITVLLLFLFSIKKYVYREERRKEERRKDSNAL